MKSVGDIKRAPRSEVGVADIDDQESRFGAEGKTAG